MMTHLYTTTFTGGLSRRNKNWRAVWAKMNQEICWKCNLYIWYILKEQSRHSGGLDLGKVVAYGSQRVPGQESGIVRSSGGKYQFFGMLPNSVWEV